MEYEGLHRKAQRSKYDCLLFDLDDTLYSLSSGLATTCRKNIEGYMAEKLEMDKSTIPEMCYLLYKTYGTTMAGLRAIGYDFDYDEYHSYVHGRLPYENLKPDPVLRNLLLASPLRKVIFTNADKIHAAKALSRLGLEDCFEGIICFETLNPSQNPPAKIQGSRQTTSTPFDILEHFARPNASTDDLPNTPIRCKPSQIAIEAALKLVNIDPQRTLFFDDSVRNIEAGKQVGLHTVIAGTCHRSKGAYFALESIHNIKEALPELLEEEAEKSDDVRFRLGLLASLTVHSLP